MEVVANTDELSREDWLDLRREGIGGSDAGPAIGKSEYGDPVEVWLEKTGRTDEDLSPEKRAELEDREKMEPIVLERIEEDYDIEVDPYPYMVHHDLYEWMRANIDGRLIGEDDVLVEVKTVSTYAYGTPHWGEEGTDQVPMHYYVQCQHYLEVFDARMVILVAYVNYRPHIYKITRDPEVAEIIIQSERAFWEYVENDEQPPIDFGHEKARDVVEKLYPGTNGRAVILPKRCEDLKRRKNLIHERIKELQELKDQVDAEIEYHLGENSLGILPSGGGWKQKVLPEKEISYTRSPSKRKYWSKTLSPADAD